MNIHFHFHDYRAPLKNRKDLKMFIKELVNKEDKQLDELQYVFCSDVYLLDINKTFLNHNTYTDIITFDLSEEDAVKGEIYISLERVKENAQKFKITFENELHRVIFHGVLHLCGYNDKLPTEQVKMRNKEDEYLKLYLEQ